MAYLTYEDLYGVKDVCVDREGSWHFPDGKELLVKGKRLVKKSGYVIYDYKNNKEIDLKNLENRTDTRCSGCCTLGGYSEVREYVDRKNKVYYVYFGKFNSYNMWC